MIALLGATLLALAPPGLQGGLAAEIDRVCPPATADRGALLRDEERIAWDARGKDAPADVWVRLGCIRARLDLADATGRQGLEMRAGDPWAVGAMQAMRRALALDPRNVAAGTVLGVVALAEPWDGVPKEILPALLADVAEGSRTGAVLRACAELALRKGDEIAADRCIRYGLAAGTDSAFHLLRRARLAYRADDSLGGHDAFYAAVAAAHDSVARAELEWHLRWFLDDGERERARGIAGAALMPWLRDRLATRDARDGRPAGARLAEHFTRYEYVLANFRLKLPRQVWKAGGLVGSTAETGGGESYELVRASCEPALIPAKPFRFYERWQREIDDRGVVWMRYGKPDKVLPANTMCPVDAAPPPSGDRPLPVPPTNQRTGEFNVREGWYYDLPEGPLVLSFEGERNDGASGATRLVAGVLGSYFCGVDAVRCAATVQSQRAAGGSEMLAVPPERLERIRMEDEERIETATTKDDHAVRAEKTIRTEASHLRLWDPRTGRPFALVPWAVRLQDLAPVDADAEHRAAQFRLAVRRWSRNDGVWSDTTVPRRLAYPDSTKTRGRHYLTGALELPAMPELSVWSLVASQDEERIGRVYDDQVQPFGEGSVLLSDLVLGSAAQGLSWRIGGENVPLAPLGAVSRSSPMSLYYQIRSDSVHATVRTVIRVVRAQGNDTEPLIDLAFDGRLTAGIGVVQRNVDLSRLDRGTWRIEVRLLDPAGKVLATRSARLLVD